jgi:hypothetical protein
MFNELIKSNTNHWSHMHTWLSNKNKYNKYNISNYHNQDKCI